MSIPSFHKRLIGCITLTSALVAGQAYASISLNGTRLILPEKQQEASLIVRNGASPVLIQSWLETHSENDQAELPFAITPPLAKIASNGQQVVRVLYAGGNKQLPSDRETVAWLNVQEIPQEVAGENQLQIAIRQRIKLFFRPAGLSGSPAQAPAAMQWSIAGAKGAPMIKIHNPSAYHVSISTLGTASGEELNDPGMIAPGETRLVPMGRASPQSTLRFEAISDYGSADPYEVQLNGGTEAQARAVSRDKP